MSSQSRKVLFFIMTIMFVFVNTSQERFLLVELDGQYEDKDVRPITDKPIGGGSKKPSTGSGFRILTGSGKPVAKQTAVDETVTVKETENEFLESLKNFSDEAPLSIEDTENIENSTNVDDSQKARKRNMERPSKGLRILPGKVKIVSFVDLLQIRKSTTSLIQESNFDFTIKRTDSQAKDIRAMLQKAWRSK